MAFREVLGSPISEPPFFEHVTEAGLTPFLAMPVVLVPWSQGVHVSQGLRHFVSMKALSPAIPDDEPTALAERSDRLGNVQVELTKYEATP
jgi:hypothetical protein